MHSGLPVIMGLNMNTLNIFQAQIYLVKVPLNVNIVMSSSFWLLGVESRDFSHTWKERTACKDEQIHKKFSFKRVLGWRFE